LVACVITNTSPSNINILVSVQHELDGPLVEGIHFLRSQVLDF
jgi:hypothetical protein